MTGFTAPAPRSARRIAQSAPDIAGPCPAAMLLMTCSEALRSWPKGRQAFSDWQIFHTGTDIERIEELAALRALIETELRRALPRAHGAD